MEDFMQFMITVLVLVILSLTTVSAQNIDYSYPNDPWIDRVLSLNQSGYNLSTCDLTVGCNLTVESNSYLEGDVTINGSTQFNDEVNIDSNLTVISNSYLGGNIQVNGTSNFVDAVTINGTTQFNAPVNVGVDGTGHDIKFYGATAGKHMLWNESANTLKLESDLDFYNNNYKLAHITPVDAAVNSLRFTAYDSDISANSQYTEFRADGQIRSAGTYNNIRGQINALGLNSIFLNGLVFGSDITYDETGGVYTITKPSGFARIGPLAVGDKIEVKNSALNDGVYTITILTSTVMTVSEALVDEVAVGNDYLIFYGSDYNAFYLGGFMIAGLSRSNWNGIKIQPAFWAHGTVENMRYINADITALGTGNTEITNFYGIDFKFPPLNGVTNVNKIGINLGDIYGASNGNYAIKTGLGDVHFGDNTTINGTLNVTGDIIVDSNIKIKNNDKIMLGDNNDYTISFDGNTGVFDQNATGTRFNGKVNITKDLSVTGFTLLGTDNRGLTNLFNEQGDLYGDGNMFTDGIQGAFAPPFGPAMLAMENDGNVQFVSLGGTGSVNGTTQIFCDTINPFNASHYGSFLTVIDSTPIDFADATGEIKLILNSSCILLSFGAAGGATIPDTGGANYIVYPHPICAFMDNGYISCAVGEDEDAIFEIHAKNGTGRHMFLLEDTANVDSRSTMGIDQNVRNADGSKAIDIVTFTDINTVGVTAIGIRIAADGTNITNSTYIYHDADLLRPSNNSQSIFARLNPFIDFIFKIGSSDELSAAWYNDTINLWNVTSNFTNEDQNTVVFEEDDSVIYVGNTLNFTSVSFTLNSGASTTIAPIFYYCNTIGVWEVFTVSDSTNGFQQSGSISFLNPNNRGVCNVDINGQPLGTQNYTYIAIERTRNFVLTDPVINKVAISGASTNMEMTKNYLKLNNNDDAPYTCDASTLGTMYFDISEDGHCECTSGGWLVMRDGTACT